MIKAKKRDLLNLWQILEGLKNKKQNVKFSYFVAKNRLAIKGEVDALNEAQEASEEFKLYDAKRAELAASSADRTADTGQPMTSNGQYVIREKKEEFEKQLAELKEQYKTAIEDRQKQLVGFKELLEETVDFKGHSIKLDNLPPDIEPTILECLLTVDLILEENKS